MNRNIVRKFFLTWLLPFVLFSSFEYDSLKKIRHVSGENEMMKSLLGIGVSGESILIDSINCDSIDLKSFSNEDSSEITSQKRKSGYLTVFCGSLPITRFARHGKETVVSVPSHVTLEVRDIRLVLAFIKQREILGRLNFIVVGTEEIKGTSSSIQHYQYNYSLQSTDCSVYGDSVTVVFRDNLHEPDHYDRHMSVYITAVITNCSLKGQIHWVDHRVVSENYNFSSAFEVPILINFN